MFSIACAGKAGPRSGGHWSERGAPQNLQGLQEEPPESPQLPQSKQVLLHNASHASYWVALLAIGSEVWEWVVSSIGL